MIFFKSEGQGQSYFYFFVLIFLALELKMDDTGSHIKGAPALKKKTNKKKLYIFGLKKTNNKKKIRRQFLIPL